VKSHFFFDVISKASAEQRLKTLETELQHKFNEMKALHENEKQDIKRQYTTMHQDLLDETNQVSVL